VKYWGILLGVLMLFPALAAAMFMRVETDRVPIDRVLTNLEQRLTTNQNDVKLLYQLARVHSMAYATNTGSIEMNRRDDTPWFGYPGQDRSVPVQVVPGSTLEQQAARRHLTNAISYYERALVLLRATNATGNAWLALPIRLGFAWTLDQAGRRQEAIAAYRDALQHAWRKEVEPDIPLKERAQWSWDQLRAGRNPLTSPPRGGYVGPGISYSEEIIGYLLRLLDPQKDAKEIAQLEADRKLVRSRPRVVTPILVPLSEKASLEQLVNPNGGVMFDLDGTGEARRWGWINTNAAWLVFDHDGRGMITSGLQLFGNVTFWIMWRDGYEALSSLDDNADGELAGAELRGLALWHDRNSNGVSDPGEVKSVAQHDITSITCQSETHSSRIPFNARGVIFANGTARPTYDWLAPGN
jgi:tetratricopeptide (TPR) repeat protein